MAENESKKDVKAEEASSGGKAAAGKADKSKGAQGPISEKQRFNYIGYEVFPGKPRDLFKSDQDKKIWVDRVLSRRDSGELSREHNTLMEQRVTMGEKLLMAVASLVLIASLFVPWYSAYTIIEESASQPAETVQPADSLAVAAEATGLDSAAIEAGLEADDTAAVLAETEQSDTAMTEAAEEEPVSAVGSEEIITSAITRHQVNREFSSLTWLGSIGAFGSISGHVFSSGGILVISGVLMLVFMLLAVALPVFNLYVLFGTGKKEDDLAVYMKRVLRLNWLPLIILTTTLSLSFFGADYGFDAASVFDSLSDSYSIGAFFNTISWGPFVVIAASILVAVKGAEI